ncbi:glycoside hydrolase [Bosea sp. RAF48]|uniref:glycoside hydrolase n=1 Tax=Bosea sp. RAF48 TaxID=3237480 RepID=UPI003F9042E8
MAGGAREAMRRSRHAGRPALLPRLIPFVAASGLAAAAALAAPATAPTQFGVNRVNLAWLDAAGREKVLDQIAQSGIRAVRLSLTNPMDASIDAVRLAHQKGLAILLEISLNNAALYPEGTKPRSGRGRIWDMYRLSDVSPELFRAALGDALQRIDRLGVALLAVEPGNEINWGAYNGDLEIRPEANTRTARSLQDLADPDAVARGAANYVQLLKVTRAELAKTKLSAGAKVVSAGLSDIPPEHADRRGIDSIDPASFTALMREHGLDQAADGYGIHVYPGGDGSPAAREQHVEQALSICRSRPAEGKPCWVTEWGFANTAKTCPADDSRRERLVKATRERFADLMRAGRIAAAFYFDWDATTYGIWRCGELSSAGRAAVTP